VTDTAVIQIVAQMMMVVAKVTAPLLLTSMAVGLTVSIFQSVTQIQEMTLTFVPKVAAVALVLILAGHWMLSQMTGFTHDLFNMIPQLIAGA